MHEPSFNTTPNSNSNTLPRPATVAVIGAGPAGLMAAQVLAQRGFAVQVFDAMPSVGRKFLLAGIGGLNLTHSEPAAAFAGRYAERQAQLEPLLNQFGAQHVASWAAGLGVSTFVGSSGRVFPTDMKAAPLLRAWLAQLRGLGVQFHMRHRWLGWADAQCKQLEFSALVNGVAAAKTVAVDATVLALGGASWARLGSDGAWVPYLEARGVAVAPLTPSNCGFDCAWSAHFAQKYAGEPLKNVSLTLTDTNGQTHTQAGEFVVTAGGVEGSLIYAFSAKLRQLLALHKSASFSLDLAPAKSNERVAAEVLHPRGARSMSSHLQSRASLTGVKAGLLREVLGAAGFGDATLLARTIKQLPITVVATRPIDEAISSAGGVPFEAIDANLMLRQLPGVFCAGEMLDWEAPTGGYLITACLATGRAAASGAASWLEGTVGATGK